MNKERFFASLLALYAIYSLIANFCLYKTMTMVALLFFAIIVGYIYLIGTGRVLRRIREAVIYLLTWGGVYGFAALYHGDKIGMVDQSFMLYGAIFLSLKLRIQRMTVIAFVWGLSILLIISLTEYVLFEVTHLGIVIGYVIRVTEIKETYFTHLLFNLVNQLEAIRLRFQWLADEPGRIGTLCGLLLFLSWRLLKNRIPFYTFLVSGLLSFSLAFYIMLLIFLGAAFIRDVQKAVVTLVIGTGILYAVHEQMERQIIERISDVESIDNRTSATFNKNYDTAIRSGQIWLGVGTDRFLKVTSLSSAGNAGGKVWIFKYGAICFILVFLIYNYLYYRRCHDKIELYDGLFLLAFWLSFYQRQYIETPYTMLVFLAMPMAREQSFVYVNKFKDYLRATN